MSGVKTYILTLVRELSQPDKITKYNYKEWEDTYFKVFREVIEYFHSQNLTATAMCAQGLYDEMFEITQKMREDHSKRPQQLQAVYDRFPQMFTDKEWLNYYLRTEEYANCYGNDVLEKPNG